jgi:hypothetical protein
MCKLVALDPVDDEIFPDPSSSSMLPLSDQLLARPKAIEACHTALMLFLQQQLWSEPDVPIAASAVAPRSKEDCHHLLQAPAGQHHASHTVQAQHIDVIDLHRHMKASQQSAPLERDMLPMQQGADDAGGTTPQPLGYIVPGVPVDADVDVAVQLQLPLLGPSPQLAKVLSTRIGCR